MNAGWYYVLGWVTLFTVTTIILVKHHRRKWLGLRGKSVSVFGKRRKV